MHETEGSEHHICILDKLFDYQHINTSITHPSKRKEASIRIYKTDIYFFVKPQHLDTSLFNPIPGMGTF